MRDEHIAFMETISKGPVIFQLCMVVIGFWIGVDTKCRLFLLVAVSKSQ